MGLGISLFSCPQFLLLGQPIANQGAWRSASRTPVPVLHPSAACLAAFTGLVFAGS
jgi:hypothetical protein